MSIVALFATMGTGGGEIGRALAAALGRAFAYRESVRRATTVRVALLVTILVFAGCAFRVASERPITLTMGPAERIRQICTEAVGRVATGCLIREGGRLIVFCPYNDARCLAQELRHAVEPESSRPTAENTANPSP